MEKNDRVFYYSRHRWSLIYTMGGYTVGSLAAVILPPRSAAGIRAHNITPTIIIYNISKL